MEAAFSTTSGGGLAFGDNLAKLMMLLFCFAAPRGRSGYFVGLVGVAGGSFQGT